ncbi:hypothetical protein ACG92U_02600 [Leuconostoc citreum]
MNLVGKQATFMHVDLNDSEINLFGGDFNMKRPHPFKKLGQTVKR